VATPPSSGQQGNQQWDARLYDAKHGFVWKHGSALLEFLTPQPGERILDLGCGTGHLTAQIATAGAEVLGIDSAAPMIDQARRTYPHLHFEVADARALTLAGSFDAVFSNAVLHWITEPARVIEGVRRALKPGGRFVAEFGGRGNVQAIVAALDRATQATNGGRFENPWYFPSIAEYATLLERGGLEVTYAVLFDRPTPLEGEAGMRHWVEMFANDLLTRVAADQREEFLKKVEEELRPVLYRDGTWRADYRRLRVVASRADP
jgi:trans-aconitate 2-methyltransferase